MGQSSQSHDTIGSLVCYNRQSGHTRTSKQSHTRGTVQQILPLLRKLLSRIFEHYIDIQDDSYISDEDIEEYPETFMPRPRIMPTRIQEPVPLQQLDTPHNSPCHNTEQSLNRTSAVSGEYCSHRKLNQKTNQCTSTLRTKMCTSQMTLWIGLMNHHRTGTCAFMMNTRTDVNILDHHPIWIL